MYRICSCHLKLQRFVIYLKLHFSMTRVADIYDILRHLYYDLIVIIDNVKLSFKLLNVLKTLI